MRYFIALFVAVPSLVASTPSVAPQGNPPPTAASGAASSKHDDAGNWHFSMDTAVDGSKTIVATLKADMPIASGFAEVTPTLVLRYRGGRTSAYILFDTFLGSGKQLDAMVTFGHEARERQTWSVSNDSRAAFAPGDALAFMDRLKHVDVFGIEIVRQKASPISVRFTTKGADVVIKALIAAGLKYTG